MSPPFFLKANLTCHENYWNRSRHPHHRVMVWLKKSATVWYISTMVLFTRVPTLLCRIGLKPFTMSCAAFIADYSPALMAVERIFVAKNALPALKLGHARGVAMLAGVNAELPVAEYTAVEVKKAVVGYGKAAKPQVQQMVKVLLNLPEIAQEDASDALAVAICHAHCYQFNSLS